MAVVLDTRRENLLDSSLGFAQGLNQSRREESGDGGLIGTIDEHSAVLSDHATESCVFLLVSPCPLRKLPTPVDDLTVIDLDLEAALQRMAFDVSPEFEIGKFILSEYAI
jgi:hypothetical protein